MLTKEDVLKVSQLARLKLSDAEVESFFSQFSSILDAFTEIEKIDTTTVAPLQNPTEAQIWLREDRVEVWAEPEAILANAPERSGMLIKVPQVVG